MLVFLLFLCIFDKHLLWEAGPDSLFMCHILNRSWSYLLSSAALRSVSLCINSCSVSVNA